MDFLIRLFWLAAMAGYNALFLSPAAVLLPLAAVFYWQARRANPKGEEGHGAPLLWLPSIGTILILICGVSFHSEVLWTQVDQKVVAIAVALMNAALIFEIGLATLVFLRLPRLRTVAVFLGLLQLWYACLCYVMAQMSVTNNWI